MATRRTATALAVAAVAALGAVAEPRQPPQRRQSPPEPAGTGNRPARNGGGGGTAVVGGRRRDLAAGIPQLMGGGNFGSLGIFPLGDDGEDPDFDDGMTMHAGGDGTLFSSTPLNPRRFTGTGTVFLHFKDATEKDGEGSTTFPPTRSPLKMFSGWFEPTGAPTDAPTDERRRGWFEPTDAPTDAPTEGAVGWFDPTGAPTRGPTRLPTRPPTRGPTREPTRGPTRGPTREPTRGPMRGPTREPTRGVSSASRGRRPPTKENPKRFSF